MQGEVMCDMEKVCKNCSSFDKNNNKCIDVNSELKETKLNNSCEWWKPIYDIFKSGEGFLE